MSAGARFNPRENKPTTVPGKSLTQKHFAAATDINNIVKQYAKTRQLPVTGEAPIYGDISRLPSYHDSLNFVFDVQRAFASLPARLRGRFQNDPGQLVRFVDNPANREECQRLGLLPMDPPAVDGQQTDLVKEAAKGPVDGPGQAALKPDDEAQPRHGKPTKT